MPTPPPLAPLRRRADRRRSRWCASEHAKAAGIYGEPRCTRTPGGEIAPEPELNDDPERPPLPAMHPVTWGAIAGGMLDA